MSFCLCGLNDPTTGLDARCPVASLEPAWAAESRQWGWRVWLHGQVDVDALSHWVSSYRRGTPGAKPSRARSELCDARRKHAEPHHSCAIPFCLDFIVFARCPAHADLKVHPSWVVVANADILPAVRTLVDFCSLDSYPTGSPVCVVNHKSAAAHPDCSHL